MNERFTTLDQVVRDICEIGGNDLDHKNYGRVLKLCVQTLRSYNLYNSTPYTKTEEIEILPNNTARLPKNALSVLRVGYTDRCGRIHEIFHNKNLSLADKYINEPCKCFDAVQQIDTITETVTSNYCNYYKSNIPNLSFIDWVEIDFGTEDLVAEINDLRLLIGHVDSNIFIDKRNSPYIITFEEIKTAIDNFTSDKVDITYTEDGKIRVTRKDNTTGIIGINISTETAGIIDENLPVTRPFTTNSSSSQQIYITTPYTQYAIASHLVNNKFEVNKEGQWIDVTSEIEDGSWSSGYTYDSYTSWRIVDSQNNVISDGLLTANCEMEEKSIQSSSYKQVEPQCDNDGKCKSCGGYVPFGYPSYSYGYNGGWYSTAYLYSRELAQGNINIPNAGQVFYEAYSAKPYPAWYGYYNVDLKNGVIRLSKKFNHQLNDKVTVVYSTDMVEVEGAKVVAVEWFDMLLYRCKEMFWSINSVDSQRNRQLYERERTRIIKIYNRQTMEEWRKAIMEVKYSGVKR